MYRFKQLMLIGGDLVCLYAGLFLALFIRRGASFDNTQAADLIGPMTILFLSAPVIMFVSGLYDLARQKRTWALYQNILISAVVWIIIGVVFFYLSDERTTGSPKTILALTAAIGFSLIAAWRTFYASTLSTGIWQSTIIFAGVTPETLELIEFLQNRPEFGYKIVGVIRSGAPETKLKNIACYADAATLPADLADTVIVSPPLEGDAALTQKLYNKLYSHIQVENLADFYEKIMKRIPPFALSETWFLMNLEEQNKKIYDRARILLDCVGALIMAVIFILTFPIIALLIKISSPGPIFFQQIRAGRAGRNFKLIKYRTMKVLGSDGSAEISGPQYASLKDDRITAVGKFLRRTRLDELPQFINILKNEMAFIGPRPERPEFVNQLTAQMPFYSIRHLIKPGLTGWAQLQSNYYATIDENLRKLEYDLYYLKNRGPLLDAIILLRTVNVILGMKGR